jgi:hypothetical protein
MRRASVCLHADERMRERCEHRSGEVETLALVRGRIRSTKRDIDAARRPTARTSEVSGRVCTDSSQPRGAPTRADMAIVREGVKFDHGSNNDGRSATELLVSPATRVAADGHECDGNVVRR